MIFKVLYQNDTIRNPKREDTKSLYLEADSAIAARQLVQDHTKYNVEFIQELTGEFLDFEKADVDFKLTEFN